MTQIMGIINLTPDSFSGDGVMAVDAALKQAEHLLNEGAALLDVGAESTRPTATPLSADEEKQRLLPVLAALRGAFPDVPLSVDTYKADVAEAALAVGATMINDVTGGRDAAMLPLAAKAECPIILMHNAALAGRTVTHAHSVAYAAPEYNDFWHDINHALRVLADKALQAGVQHERIILDAGFGFGKTVAQNLLLLKRTRELTQLGYPLLVGVSRKSFLGDICSASVDEREVPSALAAAYAANHGAAYVRVHDVRATKQALALQQALEAAA